MQGNVGMDAPARRPLVIEVLDDQGKKLEALTSAVGALQARLDFASRAQPPSPEPEQQVASTGCPLANRIVVYNDNIADLCTRINKILDALEV